MTLEQRTEDEVIELEIKFPRLLTKDEITNLFDYISRQGPFISNYFTQEEVVSGRLNGTNWTRIKRPGGICGNFRTSEHSDLSVLFDCEMQSSDDGLRYKNIKFGLPSEQVTTGEIKKAKLEIIDRINSLVKKYLD